MELSSLLSSATEDEIIVSQILCDFKSSMSLSESLSGMNKWVRRRKRSSLEHPPPVAQDEKQGGDGSPNTPLAFRHGEPDEKKSKHYSKKTVKKRSREEWMNMIAELTERKQVLSGELEKVQKYYNELKADNSQLQAMLQQRKVKSGMDTIGGGDNLGVGLTQNHHRPLNSDNVLGLQNRGPLGIDQNLIPAEEEALMMVDEGSRCTEAWRKRMPIIKTYSRRRKNSVSMP